MTVVVDTDDRARQDARRDELAEQLIGAVLGALELQAVYLGDRLGLYRELRTVGPRPLPSSPSAPGSIRATRGSGSSTRRSAGSSTSMMSTAGPDERRYSLPVGHAGGPGRPGGPLARGAARAIRSSALRKTMPELLDAYRTGAGVDWADYGPDVIEAQEAINRPQFTHLVGEWIEALPDIADRLRSGRGRVADIACGTGWSSISIAKHFPGIEVDGIDIDEGSIARAKAHAAEEGVDGRVSFRFANAAAAQGEGQYDLVTIFEALHDMARPAEVLATARRLLAPGGAVLIADERVAETFTAPGDEIERVSYGYSVTSCLPQWPGRQAVSRDRDRAAACRARGDRTRGRLQPVHDPADRAREFPLLPPRSVGPRRHRFRRHDPETGVDSEQPSAILARTDRHGRGSRSTVDPRPRVHSQRSVSRPQRGGRGGNRGGIRRVPGSRRARRRATSRTRDQARAPAHPRVPLELRDRVQLHQRLDRVVRQLRCRSRPWWSGRHLLVLGPGRHRGQFIVCLVLCRAGEPLPGGWVHLPVVEAPVEPDAWAGSPAGSISGRRSSRSRAVAVIVGYVIAGVQPAAGRSSSTRRRPLGIANDVHVHRRDHVSHHDPHQRVRRRLLSILNNIGVATEILGMVVFALILLFFANTSPPRSSSTRQGLRPRPAGAICRHSRSGCSCRSSSCTGSTRQEPSARRRSMPVARRPRGVICSVLISGVVGLIFLTRRYPGDPEHAGGDRGGPGWRVPDRHDRSPRA